MALKPEQTPLALLAALNANMPEKYRPNATVPDDGTGLEILKELKKMPRKEREARFNRVSESEAAEVSEAEAIPPAEAW